MLGEVGETARRLSIGKITWAPNPTSMLNVVDKERLGIS
jgi:hypothetical protein